MKYNPLLQILALAVVLIAGVSCRKDATPAPAKTSATQAEIFRSEGVVVKAAFGDRTSLSVGPLRDASRFITAADGAAAGEARELLISTAKPTTLTIELEIAVTVAWTPGNLGILLLTLDADGKVVARQTFVAEVVKGKPGDLLITVRLVLPAELVKPRLVFVPIILAPAYKPAASTIAANAVAVAAGDDAIVTVTTVTVDGTPFVVGVERLAFTATGGTSTGTFGPVQSPSPGVYTSVFTGVVAGTATSLGATLDGTALGFAGPAEISVVPGAPSLAASELTLEPPTLHIEDVTVGTLRLLDAFGNRITAGGHEVTLTLSPQATAAATVSSTTDHGDGSYTANIVATSNSATLAVVAVLGAETSPAAPLAVTPRGFPYFDQVLGRPSLASPKAGHGFKVDSRSIFVDAKGALYVGVANGFKIYNEVPSSSYVPYDLSFESNQDGTLDGNNFTSVDGIAVKDGKLIVSDSDNNRVLIWNTVPTAITQRPDVVLGQPSFTTKTANAGGLSASSLNKPAGIAFHGDRMLVFDSGNNRVLIWNQIPTTANAPASVVVGQVDFTTRSTGTAANRINSSSQARTIAVAGDKLFVPDFYNGRVLVWNAVPTQNGVAADLALGAAGPGAIGAGTPAATSVSLPSAVSSNGTNVVVSSAKMSTYGIRADRLTIWSQIPTASGVAADLVLGAPSFDAYVFLDRGRPSRFARSMAISTAVHQSGGKLFVANEFGRVLVWSSMPTVNDAPADLAIGGVLGPDYFWGPTSPQAIAPNGVFADGDTLYVADEGGSRILAYATGGGANDAAPIAMWGQASDIEGRANRGVDTPTALSFAEPSSVAANGGGLLVADTWNHRVLLFDRKPTDAGTPNVVVLGQPDAVTRQRNSGGFGAKSLVNPESAIRIGNKIVVADSYNHRVLIWNSVPTEDFAPADVALGQSSTSANGGAGLGATRLSTPTGLASDGQRLVVCDSYNNRVLIWNTVPTTSGVAADVVLGQADFDRGAANAGNVPAGRFSFPSGAAIHDGKLYVTDQANGRVLVWNTVPTTSSVPADAVVGQPDFAATNGTNVGDFNAKGFRLGTYVRAISCAGNSCWVADGASQRLVRFFTP